MAEVLFLESKLLRKLRLILTFLLLYGFIIYGEDFVKGLAVNGQLVFTTSEARSSPSHITATKGSSVWLHWNYTYIGDGVHFGGGLVSSYREQTIDINSTFQNKPHTLAKRIGQNGPLKLESSIPAPFNGRVGVISTNSTLVIHNLQYDDSAYLLSSAVTVDLNVGAGLLPNRYNLKPIVSITVAAPLTSSGMILSATSTVFVNSIMMCLYWLMPEVSI